MGKKYPLTLHQVYASEQVKIGFRVVLKGLKPWIKRKFQKRNFAGNDIICKCPSEDDILNKVEGNIFNKQHP